MKEYLIATFLEETAQSNTELAALPQHITLLPWSHTDADPALVYEAMLNHLQKVSPVKVLSESRDYFGSNNDKPVTRLARDPRLINLHVGLISVMRSCGAIIDKKWTGIDNWNPHVTDTNDRCLLPNVLVDVSSIGLIVRTKQKSMVVYNSVELK